MIKSVWDMLDLILGRAALLHTYSNMIWFVYIFAGSYMLSRTLQQ
jgi:hypothetical protein